MRIAWITPSYSVASQITEADLETVAARGFKAVINNRPDGEDAAQPPDAALAAAAARAGLAYRHVPVVPGGITEADVAAFDEATAGVEGPVLAFCRSGTRSTALWALAEAGRRDPDAILQAAAEAGFDLSGLRPLLEARARGARATGKPGEG